MCAIFLEWGKKRALSALLPNAATSYLYTSAERVANLKRPSIRASTIHVDIFLIGLCEGLAAQALLIHAASRIAWFESQYVECSSLAVDHTGGTGVV